MTRAVAREVLTRARAGAYAIASLNAINLETAQAVVKAAELERAPVILAFSENAARYAGLEVLAAIGRVLRTEATVPILLHYDHAETPSRARQALDLGFDLVMLEQAHTDPSVGADEVRELVDIAHAHGALVEVECDVVEKGSRDASARATPRQVADFVEVSGGDLVAIDLGTVHRQTRTGTRLDLVRLGEVAAATDAFITLHGASGVAPEHLSEAVAAGLSKVNVGTALLLAFTQAVRARLAESDGYDPRRYLDAGRDAFCERARVAVRALGGAGHAVP